MASDNFTGSSCILFESWDTSTLEVLNTSNLVILAWWPKIVPSAFLNKVIPPVVNLHPSFLPFGRGKHPNFWAIVNQETFGATIHQIDEGIDSGFLIDQEEIYYDWTDTGETLYNKALDSLKRLFFDFIASFLNKPIVITKGSLSELSPVHYAKDIALFMVSQVPFSEKPIKNLKYKYVSRQRILKHRIHVNFLCVDKLLMSRP